MFPSTIHRVPLQKLLYFSRRNFAVKELSWCATPKSSSSPNRKEQSSSSSSSSSSKPRKDTEDLKPIDAFGIVAAMSRNHVIGVDGQLPWNLPEDRKAFVALTADKILIIGRRTFEEEPNQSHICHVAQCIVVSNTMSIDTYGSDRIQLARSFPEALSLAKKLVDEMKPNKSKSDESDDTSSLDNVDCWVAGGEQLFHLALLHPSARSLHLTVVDTDIDIETGNIAKFPAKYRWDNKFELEVTSESKGGDPSFTEYVYRRIKGRR